MARILVAEDDRRTVELLAEILTGSGFDVEATSRGEDALVRLRAAPFDLVVLDVMLPGRDGFAICREIRAFSRVAIVMLTARGDPSDRVSGLGYGADDYLPKPFDPRELVARIRAVLRRTAPSQEPDTEILRAGRIALDVGARSVHLDGVVVELTTTEFDLLRVLVANAGRVVARERLMEQARGAEWAAFDRSIDVHMSHIRRKLGDDPRSPGLIKTVRGVGYHLVTKGGGGE